MDTLVRIHSWEKTTGYSPSTKGFGKSTSTEMAILQYNELIDNSDKF